MKKFTFAERKIEFEKSLGERYLSCIFDIDGTLTDVAEGSIPEYITKALAEIAKHRPIAICTGRKLEHVFLKIGPLFEFDPELRNRVFLLCENGGVGYFFDSKEKSYQEFYRSKYPYGKKQQKKLFDEINFKLGSSISSSFLNETSLVFQPLNVNDQDKTILLKRSRALLKEVEKILLDFDKNNLLKIADSGIGTIIFPIDGDKRTGVFEFGQFLQKKWGYEVSDSMKEFVIVGDKPDVYGNDETFLDGTFGTGFTVGDIVEHRLYPLPVFAEMTEPKKAARILKGSQGTFSLLQRLKFT